MLTLDKSCRELSYYGDKIYFIQQQKKQAQLFCIASGIVKSLLPEGYSVGSAINDYGGRSYCIANNIVFFCNDGDQAIYCFDLKHRTTTLFYAQPHTSFACLQWHVVSNRLLAICQQKQQQCTTQSIVAIDRHARISTLHNNFDYYGDIAIELKTNRVTICAWNQPYMPWDYSQLICGRLTAQHNLQIEKTIDHHSSTVEPLYASNGQLYYQSDHANYWQIYCDDNSCYSLPNSETSQPLWNLGKKHFVVSDRKLYAIATCNGTFSLHSFDRNSTKPPRTLARSLFISDIAASADKVAYVTHFADKTPALNLWHNGTTQNLIASQKTTATVTSQNLRAQNVPFYFHQPQNIANPPLLIMMHGGPTAMTNGAYNQQISNWVELGFAVADINYTGSSGFGRDYRQKIYGNYGKSDVADCITVAQYLRDTGLTHPQYIFIRGNSAGGFTALRVAIESTIFAGVVSRYGIADLASLADNDHFFEKNYTQRLIADKDHFLDRARAVSPINCTESIDVPVMLQHGTADKVVPFEQSQQLAQSLQAQRKTCYFIPIADEGHGFSTTAKDQMQLLEYAFLQNCMHRANPQQQKLLQRYLCD